MVCGEKASNFSPALSPRARAAPSFAIALCTPCSALSLLESHDRLVMRLPDWIQNVIRDHLLIVRQLSMHPSARPYAMRGSCMPRFLSVTRGGFVARSSRAGKDAGYERGSCVGLRCAALAEGSLVLLITDACILHKSCHVHCTCRRASLQL